MSEKGILFSAPMVRALLDGRKTQTRRLLRNPEYYGCPTGDCPHVKQSECDFSMAALTDKAKGYAPGDRLYVREHWKCENFLDAIPPRDLWAHPEMEGYPVSSSICYLATAPAQARAMWGRHRQAMHMPRWASRLWLSVTDVRVQRLQKITPDDCRAEGHTAKLSISSDSEVHDDAARDWYMDLWNSLHGGSGGWAENPWIVAVSFAVHHGNIDN